MLSAAEASWLGYYLLTISNEAAKMLRLRCAALSMTDGF